MYTTDNFNINWRNDEQVQVEVIEEKCSNSYHRDWFVKMNLFFTCYNCVLSGTREIHSIYKWIDLQTWWTAPFFTIHLHYLNIVYIIYMIYLYRIYLINFMYIVIFIISDLIDKRLCYILYQGWMRMTETLKRL